MDLKQQCTKGRITLGESQGGILCQYESQRMMRLGLKDAFLHFFNLGVMYQRDGWTETLKESACVPKRNDEKIRKEKEEKKGASKGN